MTFTETAFKYSHYLEQYTIEAEEKRENNLMTSGFDWFTILTYTSIRNMTRMFHSAMNIRKYCRLCRNSRILSPAKAIRVINTEQQNYHYSGKSPSKSQETWLKVGVVLLLIET